MKNKKPCISVLMPFYDDGRKGTRKYFLEAVDSILGQTFKDFEIVLVVSGVRGFAERLAKKSRKIRFIYVDKKGGYDSGLRSKVSGLAMARNIGVENSRGKYIAFADADDISAPGRLKAQLDFLESTPDVGVVGSNMELIGENGEHVENRLNYEKDEDIRRGFLQYNTMSQPTVMICRRLIEKAGGYNEEIAEDYDLWVRIARFTRFHNIQSPLVKYRIHFGGGANRVRIPLYLGSLKIKFKALRTLGIMPGPKDMAVNALQFISLFFPEKLRRTVLERMRGKFVVGSKQ